MPNSKSIMRLMLFCPTLLLLIPSLIGCSSKESRVIASEEEARAYAESVAPPELKQMIDSVTDQNQRRESQSDEP